MAELNFGNNPQDPKDIVEDNQFISTRNNDSYNSSSLSKVTTKK